MYGITRHATATQAERRYYECHGKDCISSARTAACPQRAVKCADLDDAVWQHVVGLLSDPDQLAMQFEQATTRAEAGTVRDQATERQVQVRLKRLEQADQRLVDAYQAGVLMLDELAERRRHLTAQHCALEQELDQLQRLRWQHAEAQEVLVSLTAFCDDLPSMKLDTGLSIWKDRWRIRRTTRSCRRVPARRPG